jgi:hypothetical protein
MTWVDTTTGAVLEEWQEGAVFDSPAPAEAAGQDDRSWLADWYLHKLGGIQDERARLKAQHAALLKELDTEERGHRWRWEERLRAVVEHDLADSTRKSKRYTYGTAGHRPRRGVDVVDKEAALAWAEEHAPAAVRVTRSLLKSELPKDVDVPGVERRTGREFYAKAGG